MRQIYKVALIFLPVIALALSGCGSSGGAAAADPFAKAQTGPGTGAVTTPITAQDPAFSLTLTTDLIKPTDLTVLPQIDVNIGTVQLTAGLTNISGGVYVDPVSKLPIASGAPVPNQAVAYRILAGPGAIGYATPVTDKNGVAHAIFTTGNVNLTTNVIIEATTTIADKNYRAYTSFQIVRGTGVIMFTSAAGTSPGGQTNMLPAVSKEVDAAVYTHWELLQLIPFKVTDSNGNPRVGVPVTISIYSITPLLPIEEGVFIDFLVLPATEATQQTITTDSAGQGIFNAVARLKTPPPGGSNVFDVVFKAVTNDPIPVTAYVGDTFTLSSKPAGPPTITPTTATLGSATDITFTIAGGVTPYSVTSNSPDRVTAALQPDGVTVLAHLVDSSQWTGPAIISVTDAAGKGVSATVMR